MRRENETWLAYAERIGCVHAHTLATTGKCDGCRKLPLSGRLYPDHVSRKLYAEMDKTDQQVA